jgi:hypothetical protein
MKRLESPGADISTPETALGRCARRDFLQHAMSPPAQLADPDQVLQLFVNPAFQVRQRA